MAGPPRGSPHGMHPEQRGGPPRGMSPYRGFVPPNGGGGGGFLPMRPQKPENQAEKLKKVI